MIKKMKITSKMKTAQRGRGPKKLRHTKNLRQHEKGKQHAEASTSQILWFPQEGPPPDTNKGAIFDPILLSTTWYNQRSYKKIRRKVLKKCSGFFVILRFRLTLMYKNCHSLLDFEATGKIGVREGLKKRNFPLRGYQGQLHSFNKTFFIKTLKLLVR